MCASAGKNSARGLFCLAAASLTLAWCPRGWGCLTVFRNRRRQRPGGREERSGARIPPPAVSVLRPIRRHFECLAPAAASAPGTGPVSGAAAPIPPPVLPLLLRSPPRFLLSFRGRPAGLSVGVARGPQDLAARDHECRRAALGALPAEPPSLPPAALPRLLVLRPPSLPRGRSCGLRSVLRAVGPRGLGTSGGGVQRFLRPSGFSGGRGPPCRAAPLLGSVTPHGASRRTRRRCGSSASEERPQLGGWKVARCSDPSWSLLCSSSEAPRQTAVVLPVGVGLEAGMVGRLLVPRRFRVLRGAFGFKGLKSERKNTE